MTVKEVESALAQDLSAFLQKRTREFTALYEQQAYPVYNLALRITCEREQAMVAAERAFLSQAPANGSGPDLAAATVAMALSCAADDPSVSGAGGPEAQEMLAAAAKLPPPERAALALAGIDGADPARIGKTMSLSEEVAAQLLDQALSDFTQTRERSIDDAQADLEGWLWAEPPVDLWENLYPRFYRAAEQHGRNGSADVDADRGGQQAGAGRLSRLSRFRLRGPLTWRVRGRRVPLWAALAILSMLIVGLALARYAVDDGGSNEAGVKRQAPAVLPGESGSGGRKALAPEQLDRLRRKELDDLAKNSKSEQARRARKRAQANAKHRPKSRQKSSRDGVVRREGGSSPVRRVSGGDRDTSTTPKPTREAPQKENKQDSSKEQDAQKPVSEDEGCLFNPDASEYICPSQSQP
jgi:hypothetical protein